MLLIQLSNVLSGAGKSMVYVVNIEWLQPCYEAEDQLYLKFSANQTRPENIETRILFELK